MQFKRHILSNGLRVIMVPMPSFESATVLVLVKAGSRYESDKNNGISHFLEHMAFKGTKRRPSAMDIATLVDGMGGEFNAFTGKETTGYFIKSHANHIEVSMDVLSDMLQNSLFKSIEIDKERGVILEEINLYEDTPSRRIGDVYENLLYKDTPMGWNIDGKKEVIKSIQRLDFLSYLSSLYSAHNITVVVAGGIDVKRTLELVSKYFGKMRRFDTLPYVKVLEDQSKPEVLIKHKKTEQVNIALGVRTVPLNHKDRYPLSVLSAILGAGMSSRLFHEVREKRGLAYYIRASSDHYQDCGTLASYSGVDPKRVDEAVKVILEEFRKVQNSKYAVKSSELKKAKEFIKGHLVLELEDSRSVAGFYAHQELLEDRIDTPEEVLVKVDKVSLMDIERVAEKYLVEKSLNLAIIGDFDPSISSGQAARQRFENLLQL